MQKICITVHSLFTTAETWKQPKCPLTHHKQGVVHTHTRNVTLFSREKEGPPVTRDSTDEPWGPYAKWADSDRNRYHTCSLYMAPKKVPLAGTESPVAVAGAGEWGTKGRCPSKRTHVRLEGEWVRGSDYGMIIVNTILRVKTGMRVNLKCSHLKKVTVFMWGDGGVSHAMVVIVLNIEVYEIETLYALSNVQCQLYINKAGNKEKKMIACRHPWTWRWPSSEGQGWVWGRMPPGWVPDFIVERGLRVQRSHSGAHLPETK